LITFALLNGLNSESRGIINFYPLFVFCAAGAFERAKLSRWFLASFAVVSVAASKVWLTIDPLVVHPGKLTRDFLVDNQLLFMNNGPGMMPQWYLMQAGIVGLTTLIFRYVLAHSVAAVCIDPKSASVPAMPAAARRSRRAAAG